MSVKDKETELRIAKIQRQIDATNAKMSIYYKGLWGIQNAIAAVGGRTFLLVFFAIIASAIESVAFFYFQKESYMILLIGQVPLAAIPWVWIYRNKLKSIKGPGGFEADLQVTRMKNITRQKPNRKTETTFANWDPLDPDTSEALESESESMRASR